MKREDDGWSRRLRKPRQRGGLSSGERHRLLGEAVYRAEQGGFPARGDRVIDPFETDQEHERQPAGH
jgi:hypothetical protein